MSLRDERPFSGQSCQQAKQIPTWREMDPDTKNEYWASLSLRHCQRTGLKTVARLLRHYKSAHAAVQNVDSWPDIGISRQCVNNYREELWRPAAKREWDSATRSDSRIILWKNDLYPGLLRQISDPPALLYCSGKINLLTASCVAVVGSRNASEKNLEIAFVLAKKLSTRGITVVSGMASGIDRRAHLGALAASGKSIGVLGTGTNIQYPPTNADLYGMMNADGLLISEFSPDTPPAGNHFPVRNRIISGMSLGVLVVEAAARSGSLITARLALEQNREVFALPGEAMSNRCVGCHNLIREGAHPVFCVDDILYELSAQLHPYGKRKTAPVTPAQGQMDLPGTSPYDFPPPPDADIEPPAAKVEANMVVDTQIKSETALKIMSCLADGPKHADVIAQTLQADIKEINSQLIFLELHNEIRRLPGARFQVVK